MTEFNCHTYVENKNITPIWYAKNAHIQMYSDDDQFICKIDAGFCGETPLSVGYSCPNYAQLSTMDSEKVRLIYDAIEEYWNKEDRYKDLDDMLPTMLEMCKIANEVYNDLI